MGDAQYYNYMNLESYLNKLQLKYDGEWLRWVKDIINTSVTMFSWELDPKYELTSEIIEKSLMFNNFLCFADVPGVGFGLYRWRCGSQFNRYWKPEKVGLMTLTGKNVAWDYPYNKIVLLRDNPMDIIPFLTLNDWISKIIDKERTLDSIFAWISLPIILAGDKEQTTMLKNVMKKSLTREPFLVASKGFKDHIESFDIKLPVELQDVYDIMKKYRGLALASMGIYEVDEKRERIVTSEIQAQNDYVDMVYTGKVNERKRACEECKRMFGVEIRFDESYMQNQRDEIKLKKQTAEAEKSPDIEIAEIKAEGEIEAAKQGGNNNA